MTATSSCDVHFNVGPKSKRKTTTHSSPTLSAQAQSGTLGAGETHTEQRLSGRRGSRPRGAKWDAGAEQRLPGARGRGGAQAQSRGCRERAAGRKWPSAPSSPTQVDGSPRAPEPGSQWVSDGAPAAGCPPPPGSGACRRPHPSSLLPSTSGSLRS